MKQGLVGVALGIAAVFPVRAELPSFDNFYDGVSKCQLEFSRYGELLEPHQEAVIIALPSAGVVRGFLIDSFYFEPARGAAPEQYGLLINGPIEAVGPAFPELLERRNVNGYLRRLIPLSEQSRQPGSGRKTLLICVGGTAT
ncbi:MAG TPA: hypothetical protein VFA81_09215 [Burkholderiales bacterium]|nr:hypothetical protein [Burkholderiales bacterium]